MPDKKDDASNQEDGRLTKLKQKYSDTYSNMFEAGDLDLVGDEIVALLYVPVGDVQVWDENAKLHDYGALIESIQEHGFRDPPSWDAQLGGVVEGNGRTSALMMMEQDGSYDPPRGILVHGETGRWCMPINFGLDAKSKNDAMRYAVDHNNLVLAGGDFTAYDMARMWDQYGYKHILSVFQQDGKTPMSMDMDDISIMIDGFDFELYDDMADEADTDVANADDSVIIGVRVPNPVLEDEVRQYIQDLLYLHEDWGATLVVDD